MATSQMRQAIRLLRTSAVLRERVGLTDGQLLDGFISRREEAALAVLVQRHAPMVWGVCRRVLDNYHDAEDAFQATFLVLVRKAASIAPREMVVNWLHGVARQTALKARASAARRKGRERQVTQMPEPELQQQEHLCDLQCLLDRELSRLPEKYRVVLLLCDLEGRTRKEAARQLDVPEGTVAGRLARARVMLAKRLHRHVPPGSSAATTVLLSNNTASACVPAPLLKSTIQAATFVAANPAATGVVSASVAALTEGVLKAMLMTKLKVAGAVLMIVVALLGVGWGLYPTNAATPPDRNAKAPQDAAAERPAGIEQGVKGLTLPQGPPPVQVLVSLQKDGKLLVKSTHMFLFGMKGQIAQGNPPVPFPGPGPGIGGIQVKQIKPGAVGTQTYDLTDVQVVDTTGRKLDKKDLGKLLKEETVATASFAGMEVDPLHLRILKEGTLVFILPMPKMGGGPGGPPGFLPGGQPGFVPVPGGVLPPPGQVIPPPGPEVPLPPQGAPPPLGPKD